MCYLGVLVVLFVMVIGAKGVTDTPCLFSAQGATWDLRPLTVTSQSEKSYYILDGDIPCTPETEPSFSYTWNFCAQVTTASLPGACTGMGKTGVALQYLQLPDVSDCYIIGRYDPTKDDSHYKLLDPSDPSKGISMVLPSGERCMPTKTMRTTTIDVECANSKTMVLSANSPGDCAYHLSMKSLLGCPVQCAVTANGLCNSHGHCAYDVKGQTPYCYCNEGYYGADCSSTTNSKSSAAQSSDGHSLQVGLLVTLLIVMLLMVGAVGFMAYKISQYRKETSVYNLLSSTSTHGDMSGSMEMVETVNF